MTAHISDLHLLIHLFSHSFLPKRGVELTSGGPSGERRSKRAQKELAVMSLMSEMARKSIFLIDKHLYIRERAIIQKGLSKSARVHQPRRSTGKQEVSKGENTVLTEKTVMCRLRMGHRWLNQIYLLKMRNSLTIF
ncbi:hypothetical protein PoB_006372400 [Plakobranchus ocellatus]|uniref:Uncharacterized protein n=1 Tax=Plakobranchus ocellatus TaxID=259542 RepID=A0AAV4CZG5_9GAST|nr:hypothetical protein PoB_006372400 [Plakobranchus ocellatus]